MVEGRTDGKFIILLLSRYDRRFAMHICATGGKPNNAGWGYMRCGAINKSGAGNDPGPERGSSPGAVKRRHRPTWPAYVIPIPAQHIKLIYSKDRNKKQGVRLYDGDRRPLMVNIFIVKKNDCPEDTPVIAGRSLKCLWAVSFCHGRLDWWNLIAVGYLYASDVIVFKVRTSERLWTGVGFLL